jgi:iduronate 2-sulfatase
MWCKHSNYEQAARIPIIVVAPGVTEGGAVSQSLVESVDIYPTLCKLADLPVPDALDGVSFEAALNNPAAATKEAVIHVYPRRDMIGRAVRTARHRLVEWKQPSADADGAILELYDYEADPDETKNLAVEQPEVVAELRAILAKEPEAKPQLQNQNNNRQRERANRRRAARNRS